MNKALILAGDFIGPLGNSDQTWQGMELLRTGLRKTRFSSTSVPYHVGLIEHLGGTLGSRERMCNLLDFLIDKIKSKVALPDSTPVYIATTKGGIDQLLALPLPQEAIAKEQTQPWQLGNYFQTGLEIRGECVMTSAACASGSIAVIQAAMGITSGRHQLALVIGVDLVAEFILAGFDSLKALSEQPAKPFDQKRDGLSLGDGGGWAIVASEKGAEELDLQPLAEISSWGMSCDAGHITAPCREGSGLKRVFQQVVSSTSRVGGIVAHGTGTVYNDAMEMLVFRESCGEEIPYCSVKGALGHSLGATGLIEILLSIKSLQEKTLPPTVGLMTPDAAAGNVSGTDPLTLLSPSIITCNSGFGGINAGVLLTLPKS